MTRSEINSLNLSGDAFRFLEIVCRNLRTAQSIRKPGGCTVWNWQNFFGQLHGTEGWTASIAQELKEAGIINQSSGSHKTDSISLTNKGVSYARACAC